MLKLCRVHNIQYLKKNIIFVFIFKPGMENPASKKIHEETYENIDKCTRYLYYFCVKITVPGVMIPQMITSYLNYFTTDMGKEAFKLPYPEW